MAASGAPPVLATKYAFVTTLVADCSAAGTPKAAHAMSALSVPSPADALHIVGLDQQVDVVRHDFERLEPRALFADHLEQDCLQTFVHGRDEHRPSVFG